MQKSMSLIAGARKSCERRETTGYESFVRERRERDNRLRAFQERGEREKTGHESFEKGARERDNRSRGPWTAPISKFQNRWRAGKKDLKRFARLFLRRGSNQGQNLALTILYVPSSLDSGLSSPQLLFSSGGCKALYRQLCTASRPNKSSSGSTKSSRTLQPKLSSGTLNHKPGRSNPTLIG